MKSDNIKYFFLQGSYWMHFTIGFGYATFYLLKYGFSAGEIGVLTAVFGLLAAVLQGAVGSIGDKSKFWNWKRLLLVLIGACLIDTVLLSFTTTKWLTGLFYGMYLMFVSSMMGLVNSASFYYNRNGVKINFGIARGIGSLSYAVLSLFLGQLTLRFGTLPINVLAISNTLLMGVVVCSMRTFPEEKVVVLQKEERKKGGFFRKYPFFALMIVGTTLLLAFHNISITYLLQLLEKIGGNSQTLGNVLALSAVVELPILFGFAWIVKRQHPSKLLLLSAIAFVLKGTSYVVALVLSSVPLIFAAQLFQTFSFAIFASASVYYTEQLIEKDDRMRGHAWMGNVPTIGAVIGNLSGGWLLDGLGVMGMLLSGVGIAVVGLLFVAFAQWNGKGMRNERESKV